MIKMSWRDSCPPPRLFSVLPHASTPPPPPALPTQTAVSTCFTLITSALAFYVSPYNDYRKNTNEMTMALMKPGIFLLGEGWGLWGREVDGVRGLWGREVDGVGRLMGSGG